MFAEVIGNAARLRTNVWKSCGECTRSEEAEKKTFVVYWYLYLYFYRRIWILIAMV